MKNEKKDKIIIFKINKKEKERVEEVRKARGFENLSSFIRYLLRRE